jgi:hypothetical protein
MATTGTRTLLRPGRKAHLIRIDGRGGARFYVGGPKDGERHSFADLRTAVGWFETVERERESAPSA